jgi:hypothetical protein
MQYVNALLRTSAEFVNDRLRWSAQEHRNNGLLLRPRMTSDQNETLFDIDNFTAISMEQSKQN